MNFNLFFKFKETYFFKKYTSIVKLRFDLTNEKKRKIADDIFLNGVTWRERPFSFFHRRRRDVTAAAVVVVRS